MIEIVDKEGLHHVFNIQFLERVEFTRGTITVILKDSRSDPVKLKAAEIHFS